MEGLPDPEAAGAPSQLASDGVAGCKGPVTPGGVEDAAAGLAPIGDALCKWIEGLTDVGAIVTICAVAEELGLIASVVAPLLGSESPDAGPCMTIPTTTVCATKSEIGKGIEVVLDRRRARLLLDAGPAKATSR